MEDRTPSPRQRRCRRPDGLLANFGAALTGQGIERVVAFDEGRFGLKLWFRRCWCTCGHRPPWIVADHYQWVWVYVAITPATGECCCLLLPHVDTLCLDAFLETLRAEWPAGRIGVVLDGSGSHRSGDVHWPEGIVPLPLPPYSPELNPAEQIFRHLRKRLANRRFATIGEMGDTLVEEMQRLGAHPKVVTRMTYYPWWRDGIAAISPPLS